MELISCICSHTSVHWQLYMFVMGGGGSQKAKLVLCRPTSTTSTCSVVLVLSLPSWFEVPVAV